MGGDVVRVSCVIIIIIIIISLHHPIPPPSQQVSYGEMIACDNAEKCPYEWFHLDCVGLSAAPSDRWFCPICKNRQ